MTDDNNEQKKPGLMTLPWFKPLYRRVILIAIIAVWCAWEWFFNQSPDHQFWGYITLAALAYGVWTFFITFDKELKKLEDAKPKS